MTKKLKFNKSMHLYKHEKITKYLQLCIMPIAKPSLKVVLVTTQILLFKFFLYKLSKVICSQSPGMTNNKFITPAREYTLTSIP